jgi:hypothetical protein
MEVQARERSSMGLATWGPGMYRPEGWLVMRKV